MDLKWSLLTAHANGSKNLYHNNRSKGRIVLHLEPRQSIAQYLTIHGKLPNWTPRPAPRVDPIRLAAYKKSMEKKQAAIPKVSNYFLNNLRRGLIQLYKPWAMTKNSLNSIKTQTGPGKNLKKTNITIRKKNQALFTNKLKEMGWAKASNTQFHRVFPIKGSAGGRYGFFIILRASNSNNFIKRTRMNNKIPVIN